MLGAIFFSDQITFTQVYFKVFFNLIKLDSVSQFDLNHIRKKS